MQSEIGCSETTRDIPEDQENQYEQQECSHEATGGITPVAAVFPLGTAKKEQKHQHT
jgi:hypothetical protein